MNKLFQKEILQQYILERFTSLENILSHFLFLDFSVMEHTIILGPARYQKSIEDIYEYLGLSSESLDIWSLVFLDISVLSSGFCQ